MHATAHTISDPLATADPEVFSAIHAEEIRQRNHVELIASENSTSAAVMRAQGSLQTNNNPLSQGRSHPRDAMLRSVCMRV